MKVYRIEIWNKNDDLFKTIIAVAEDFDAAVRMIYEGMNMDSLHIGKMEQLSTDLTLVGQQFYEKGVARKQK